MIAAESTYRGGSTVEVTIQEDEDGFLYSAIEVVSDINGATLLEGYADDILTATDAWRIASALGAGRPVIGVAWNNEAMAA